MNRDRPRWAWLFFIQLAVVIGASVLAATGHFPGAAFQHAPFDKVGHLMAYGGLAFLGVAFFGRTRSTAVIVGLLVASTLEEVSQRAFRTRTFDLGDLAMNLIGIATFGATAAAILARGHRRRRPSAPAGVP